LYGQDQSFSTAQVASKFIGKIWQPVHPFSSGRAEFVRIVNSMGLTALDLGLRGAAAGLFLMMVVVVAVRVRPLSAIKSLGAAMAAAGAAYAIVTAPFVPKAAVWWTLPIMAANPVIFWLWARATFDDDFVVRR
jgi:hypothetical protein